LGEWYADIEWWRSMPVIIMLNAETGVTLVLPGNVRNFRELEEIAEFQFLALCKVCGIESPLAQEEARHLKKGFMCATTRSRSLVGSLQQRKFELLLGLEDADCTIFEMAQSFWTGLFLPPGGAKGLHYRRPIELLSSRFAEISATNDSSLPGN
jgi:hypothetical protein